jgi:hypothetical protein
MALEMEMDKLRAQARSEKREARSEGPARGAQKKTGGCFFGGDFLRFLR